MICHHFSISVRLVKKRLGEFLGDKLEKGLEESWCRRCCRRRISESLDGDCWADG